AARPRPRPQPRAAPCRAALMLSSSRKYPGGAAAGGGGSAPILQEPALTHRFPVRVYYEDTDLGQVVYYANYLKFIERGRSEWLRAAGVDQSVLLERGLAFVVRRVEADYLRPARFDDELEVVTTLDHANGPRITVAQAVERDGAPLFRAVVTVVCVDLATMRPQRLPPDVLAALSR